MKDSPESVLASAMWVVTRIVFAFGLPAGVAWLVIAHPAVMFAFFDAVIGKH